MHKLLFPFALAALAATAQAEVNCKIGGAAIAATDVQTMFHYSASGQRGANGRLSHFRLMTDDNAAGKSSGVELKTVDVTTPGDYELSTESGWRSAIMVQGKRQYVNTGKFTFTHFEVKGSRGRAAGTLEFTTTQTRGECRFSIEIQAFDRDTVGR